jgi:hypothetical protein
MLNCQQTTLMPRTRPLYKVLDQIRSFLQIDVHAITQTSTNPLIFPRVPHLHPLPVGEEDTGRGCLGNQGREVVAQRQVRVAQARLTQLS